MRTTISEYLMAKRRLNTKADSAEDYKMRSLSKVLWYVPWQILLSIYLAWDRIWCRGSLWLPICWGSDFRRDVKRWQSLNAVVRYIVLLKVRCRLEDLEFFERLLRIEGRQVCTWIRLRAICKMCEYFTRWKWSAIMIYRNDLREYKNNTNEKY